MPPNLLPEIKPTTPARQGGFALIVVIWLGVLLSIMAAAFTSAVKSRIRTTSAAVEAARAEALATAGVRIAILDLLSARDGTARPPRFGPGAPPVVCQAGTGEILTISVDDEEGKVNLNTPNERLLTALLVGLGAGASDARGMAAKILDYRDIDNDKRPDGAERDDYAKAQGVHALPKNSDFTSVDELDQVLGLPGDVVARMKPFVTVLSNQSGIDPAVASRELKSILRKGASGATDASAGLDDGIFSAEALPPEFVSPTSRRGFSIRAEAQLASGARFVSEALIGLQSGNGATPNFRQWRRVPSPQAQPQSAQGIWPPC